MNGERIVTGRLADVLAHNWWVVFLRGLLAILFGILAFIWPGLTVVGLIYLFGIYALINGGLAFSSAANAPKGCPRFGATIFEGALSIAAGVLAFLLPGLTAMALLVLIAFWAIFNGFVEIFTAIRLRKEINNEWWLILAGFVSVIFGAILLRRPGAGILVMVWWVGAWAVVFGIFMVALSFRVHSLRRNPPEAAAPLPA